MAPAVPVVTRSNATYAVVEMVEPDLYLARAQSDARVQAYGRTEPEALEKLRHRIESAEDRAA